MSLPTPASQDDVADLTESWDFTFTLLDDTRAWRHRLVEEFVFLSSWHVGVSSSYQLELPSDLIQGRLLPGAARARVLVPLTTRPKRPLMGFSIRAPAGASGAHLLLRASIASFQAEYLTRLRIQHPRHKDLQDGLPVTLLEAISLFPPSVYRHFDPHERIEPGLLAAYLAAGLEIDIPVSDAERWMKAQAPIAEILATALDEPPDRLSSSENVLLALPYLDPKPTSPNEIDSIVDSYGLAVRAARNDDQVGLLVALAEYGRRWELIVETELSLRQPSTLTVLEERPLDLVRRRTRQRVALGDARSTHAQFRVADHAVEIAGFDVRDVKGDRVGIPHFEGVRKTADALALYSSEGDRPYYADVDLRLRPTADLRATWGAFEVLILVSLVVAVILHGPDVLAALGLVTIPTTFAVALLLVRERSSLASQLQQAARFRMLAEVAGLYSVVFTRLL